MLSPVARADFDDGVVVKSLVARKAPAAVSSGLTFSEFCSLDALLSTTGSSIVEDCETSRGLTFDFFAKKRTRKKSES